MQEVAKAENFELSRSAVAGGTVVIGNISPHQSDSSESPPSYNQLTYNENLTRWEQSASSAFPHRKSFSTHFLHIIRFLIIFSLPSGSLTHSPRLCLRRT